MTAASHATRSEGAQPRRTFLILGGLPVAGILVFTFGLALGVRGPDVTMLAVALLTAAVATVPLALDQSRVPSRRHLLVSMFSLSFMIYLVVPVFTYYLPGDEPKIPPGMRWAVLAPEDVVRGQLVTLTGLLALLVGYALPLGRGAAAFIPPIRRDWSHPECILAALIMTGVGWTIFLSSQFGMIPAFVGSGVTGAFAAGYVNGLVVLAFAYLRFRSRAALALLIVLVPITMSVSFFTGSKTAVLSVAALIVLASVIHRGRIRLRWIVVAVLALTLLYPVARFYREVVLHGLAMRSGEVLARPGETLDMISRFAGSMDVGEYLSSGLESVGTRLDALGRASGIIRETPRMVPFQGGWTLGYIALAYVPRILWPEKPTITIGQWITDHYGSGPEIRSNTGPTWIGEFYMNFGLPGVIGGMFIMGFLLRLAHQVLLVKSRTIPAHLLAVIALMNLVTSVGGGVVGAVNGVVFSVGPILLYHMLIRLIGGRSISSSVPASTGTATPTEAGAR